MRRRDALALLFVTVTLPRGARAQQAEARRIGLLLLSNFSPLTDSFFAALHDRGWSRGRNLAVEIRETAREQARGHEIARELIDARAHVIATVGTANAVAARMASSRVPIVMLTSGFPVESGLAASLSRPGGNVTGLSIYAGSELFGKYVALVKELVPQARDLGIFWGYAPPAFPEQETELLLGEMHRAAAAH